MKWFHQYILGHKVTHRKVTVPWWDVHSRGDLFRCDCSKRWSR